MKKGRNAETCELLVCLGRRRRVDLTLEGHTMDPLLSHPSFSDQPKVLLKGKSFPHNNINNNNSNYYYYYYNNPYQRRVSKCMVLSIVPFFLLVYPIL